VNPQHHTGGEVVLWKKRGDAHKFERAKPWEMFEYDIESWIEHWGSEKEARRAWEALKDGYHITPGQREVMWWWYEPGIPKELRDVPDEAWALKSKERDAARDAFDAMRLAWLKQSGHMSEQELATLTEWESRRKHG
jgi:hypothetical protein